MQTWIVYIILPAIVAVVLFWRAFTNENMKLFDKGMNLFVGGIMFLVSVYHLIDLIK